MTIYTGIGGWTYEPWRGLFFPDDLRHKDELAYAAARMDAIEVNANFYRLQKPQTFARWREETPDGFVFALKGSRYVVTRKRLADAGEAVERFIEQGIAELGDKLGPVLWQMPKTRAFDPDDLAAFLALLPREVAGLRLRHAIEAQHESFDCEAFVEVASKADVAIAYIDADDVPSFDGQTTDFSYARLKRARPSLKRGYPPADLERFASMARNWGGEGHDVFMFCINGAKERAPAAAMALAKRMRG
ncbi:DUF72 domain-containing protein [Croceicoccus pelagius]|uniref:DUF72 domain-containing protein n=1 Tax=Croceicoccus pelagius TaxID=1703341 RepID=A0A916Y4A3_9SPHN|nr:DUF72 domain-containing protein [Croceicoccus pelagius]GGD30401.1 hypothetical protein GCM10010989_00600 [Croceicoccus pelagius]